MKIDLDPDGQYSERSVGSYSHVCNEMFITMGRLLNRSDLLDVARKNLDMTLYYIQPGEKYFLMPVEGMIVMKFKIYQGTTSVIFILVIWIKTLYILLFVILLKIN